MIVIYGLVMLVMAYLLYCFMDSYINESPFQFIVKFDLLKIVLSVLILLWICIFSIGLHNSIFDTFTYFKYSIVVVFVLVIAFIDAKTYTIPLVLLYVLIGLRIILILFEILLNSSMIMDIFQLYGFGILFALGISGIVYFISKKGLGEGDIILITIIASYVGLYNIMAIYFLSSVLMLIIALFLVIIKKNKMKDVFPMVPAIAIALIVNTLIIYFL